MTIRRKRKGRLHRLASALTICALATLCGVRGTRAIADFAEYLNPTQLRLLRCYYSKARKRYEPPSEPTIRRILQNVSTADFDREIAAWLAEQDDPTRRLAVDGKTVKKAVVNPGSLGIAAVGPELTYYSYQKRPAFGGEVASGRFCSLFRLYPLVSVMIRSGGKD